MDEPRKRAVSMLTDERRAMDMHLLALLGDVPQEVGDIQSDLLFLKDGGTLNQFTEELRESLRRCRENRWVAFTRQSPSEDWTRARYAITPRGRRTLARRIRTGEYDASASASGNPG